MASIRRSAALLTKLLIGALIAGSGTAAAEDAGASLYIQVKSVRLRTEPRHWAAASGDVVFGAAVTKIEQSGDWYKVRGADGAEGFVHSSAVTSRTVVFKGALEPSLERVEPADVVLAGKGFASQLETSFRSGEPGLDYAAVDRLEQRFVDGPALENFLKAGKLRLDAIERSSRG